MWGWFMLYKMFFAAVFAIALVPMSVGAQNIAQIGGPAEQPPSNYKGLQYTDSRGCVFMRVESSGAAKWYPRVNAARKPVCNKGSAGKVDMASDLPAPARVSAPVVPAKPIIGAAQAPMETVASKMMPQVVQAPVVVAAAPVIAPMGGAKPSVSYERVASAGPAKGQIACSTSAPVAEVVRLRNGGSGVMCTKGDGTTNGWHAPTYPAGSPPGISLHDPVKQTASAHPTARVMEKVARPAQRLAEAPTIFTPPKGYKAAWKDDRLNPKRGIGTPEGQALQDRVWTRKVPAQIVTAATAPIATKSRVTVSTMNASSMTTGRSFVQIGTFGVAANATGVAARLQAMGLPVATTNLVKAGKPLQIVLAGPFGSADQAQAALRIARQAGFGDAFLR